MTPLAVFDLDGTLIEGDSFGRLIKARLLLSPALLRLALARKLGRLDRAGFAEQAHQCFQADFARQDYIDDVCATNMARTIPGRLDTVAAWKARGAHVILLSASPQDYVVPLARAMGFDAAYGSHWAADRYRHLHGEAKLAFVDATFPPDQWHRVYAMADQDSDMPLLEAFETFDRV